MPSNLFQLWLKRGERLRGETERRPIRRSRWHKSLGLEELGNKLTKSLPLFL